MMNWNVLSHARPANDNTLLRDCDFLKDERLIKIGRTYVRLVKFHFQMEKKLPTLNFKQLGLKGPNTLKFLCNQMPQRSLSNPEDWPENSGFDPRACAPLISWIFQMLFEVMWWIDTETSTWVDPPERCIGDMSIRDKFLTFFHSNWIIWQISPYFEDMWPNALWKNPLPHEERGWRLAADSASRVGGLASHCDSNFMVCVTRWPLLVIWSFQAITNNNLCYLTSLLIMLQNHCHQVE